MFWGGRRDHSFPHISLKVRRGAGRGAWDSSYLWTTWDEALLLDGGREAGTEFPALLLEWRLEGLETRPLQLLLSLAGSCSPHTPWPISTALGQLPSTWLVSSKQEVSSLCGSGVRISGWSLPGCQVSPQASGAPSRLQETDRAEFPSGCI